jgi:hypothetical protein
LLSGSRMPMALEVNARAPATFQGNHDGHLGRTVNGSFYFTWVVNSPLY